MTSNNPDMSNFLCALLMWYTAPAFCVKVLPQPLHSKQPLFLEKGYFQIVRSSQINFGFFFGCNRIVIHCPMSYLLHRKQQPNPKFYRFHGPLQRKQQPYLFFSIQYYSAKKDFIKICIQDGNIHLRNSGVALLSKSLLQDFNTLVYCSTRCNGC